MTASTADYYRILGLTSDATLADVKKAYRKLARQYHTARGERRWKAISRNVAYHGTTMGALSINGVPALRAPFEPLVPSVARRGRRRDLVARRRPRG